ncbi:hypothetical protein [Haliovirga abyssi]|uniref:Uncharacterized protein n=1 Tax=Haliovirga abyssi TaxID=2996794 RepID=A0AAU9DE79_9FUSO|nr:hypothetical protein [Haliovirga abyssi]BDU51655.1 hypothetical protein HLVA_22240 [Haliovirga abyssi]
MIYYFCKEKEFNIKVSTDTFKNCESGYKLIENNIENILRLEVNAKQIDKILNNLQQIVEQNLQKIFLN